MMMKPIENDDDIPAFLRVTKEQVMARKKAWETRKVPTKEVESSKSIKPISEEPTRTGPSYNGDQIAELEGLVQDNMDNPEEFDFHDWMMKREVGPFTLRYIVDNFTAVIKELQEVMNLRKTKKYSSDMELQLLEGYRRINNKEVIRLIEYGQEIILAAQNILENKKRARKPRKSKRASVEKIVAHAHYTEIEPVTKIASLPPEKIIGKTVVWAYDSEKRFLKVYQAKEGSTLTFNRTSIENADESLSWQKKVRKPEVILPVIASEAKNFVMKTFKDIKAVEAPLPSMRTNKHFVFLRVF